MHLSTMFALPIVMSFFGIFWATFCYYVGYPFIEAIVPWLNDSNFVLYASIFLLLPLFTIVTIQVVVFKIPEKNLKRKSD